MMICLENDFYFIFLFFLLLDLLSESHDKYGSAFKLWLGPTQLLVSMKDPTLIKDMLSKAGDKLPCIGKAFRLAFGRSSLFFCSYDQVEVFLCCLL